MGLFPGPSGVTPECRNPRSLTPWGSRPRTPGGSRVETEFNSRKEELPKKWGHLAAEGTSAVSALRFLVLGCQSGFGALPEVVDAQVGVRSRNHRASAAAGGQHCGEGSGSGPSPVLWPRAAAGPLSAGSFSLCLQKIRDQLLPVRLHSGPSRTRASPGS